VYVYQTYDDGGLKNRILRLRYDGDTLERSAVVLDGIPGAENHNGGRIAFGPDDKLYATTGDALDSSAAQQEDSLSGKILRLEPDGSIPQDNPIDGSPVWSYGHRNPQGIAWGPRGQLYATEHSSDSHDEVNRIRPGKNYGWPDVIGKSEDSDYTDPVLESGDGVWAPSGATFYGGSVFTRWTGDLFFCTLGFTQGGGRRSLHRVSFKKPGGRAVAAHERLFENQFGRLRAVTDAPDGTLYVGTSNRDGRGDPTDDDDRILRIAPE
jgi:glucose/arabinose dehydrogenase